MIGVSMIEFIENEPGKVWCAYRAATGLILGEVRHGTTGFQVYILGVHARLVAQGAPHASLAAAKADLTNFLK